MSTKYEDALQIMKSKGSTLSTLKTLLVRYTEPSHADKGGIKFRAKMGEGKIPCVMAIDGWNHGIIEVDAYIGYYGNSSCSDKMHGDVLLAIVDAINLMQPQIIEKAIGVIESSIAKAKREAADEARTVLADLTAQPASEDKPLTGATRKEK